MCEVPWEFSNRVPESDPEGFLELDLSDAEKQSVKAINLEARGETRKHGELYGGFFGQMGGSIFFLGGVYGWFK